MLTRDAYITLLEKRSSTEEPDYTIDSRQVAQEEHKANLGETAGYLKGLFNEAKGVEKQQSKEIGKLLKHKGESDTSNPFLKLGYDFVMFRAFQDELRKLNG